MQNDQLGATNSFPYDVYDYDHLLVGKSTRLFAIMSEFSPVHIKRNISNVSNIQPFKILSIHQSNMRKSHSVLSTLAKAKITVALIQVACHGSDLSRQFDCYMYTYGRI